MQFHSFTDRRTVKMGSCVLLLILINIFCTEVLCNFTSTQKPEISTAKNATSTMKPKLSWTSLILRRGPNANQTADATTSSPRKSRFLGGLAFLAGLSAGSLAHAASSTSKTIARLPPASVTLNLGPPRLSPYFAAYYDPYGIIPHHFLYSGGLGLYPYVHPSRLQSPVVSNIQNEQLPIQNLLPQVLSVLNNKRPGDSIDNEEEEIYVQEVKGEKKSDDDMTQADDRQEATDESNNNVKLQSSGTVSNEEHVNRVVACTTSGAGQKRRNHIIESFKEHNFSDLQPEADDSGTLNFRARNNTSDHSGNKTQPSNSHHTHHKDKDDDEHTHPIPVTISPASNNTENSTNNNHTGYPPYFGYYGGSPQDISHVDLTTDSEAYRYPDYNHINYNVPYEKPASFYPDDKYSYTNPPQSSYPTNLFIPPDQNPEYVHNDYSKYLYAPDNGPTFVNGFRPVV